MLVLFQIDTESQRLGEKIDEISPICITSVADDPDPEYQYWLGARDFRFHNDHVPGDWHWDTG